MGTIIPNMGIRKRKSLASARTGLGDALFTRTQQKVLGLLFGQAERSFYANELIRLAAAGSGAVQRELERLTHSGLVTARVIGNQKFYQANAESPLYDDLRSITSKTFGLADPLRAALAAIAHRIRAAFVYGSVAKKSDTSGSDIDLMVIADKLNYSDLLRALEDTVLAINRPVNPTIFSAEEFALRRRKRDSFVYRVLEQPRIWLIGGEIELPS